METCQNCDFYVPHYIRWHRDFNQICCGHCTKPRMKTRQRHTPACEYWQPISGNYKAVRGGEL